MTALNGSDMNFTRTEERLLGEMAEIEIIDCHEHLPPEKVRVEKPQDVFTLFSHYTRIPLMASGMTQAEKESLHDPAIPLEKRWKLFRPHLRNSRFTSYARPAFIAAQEIYGFDDINDETYRPLSDAINAANKPGIYSNIFKRCHIRAVLDQCASTALEPPLIPVMPGLKLFGIREKSHLDKLSAESGAPCGSLEEHLAACRIQLERWIAEGTVGIKTYSKTNTPPDAAAARDAFKRLMAGEELVPDSRDYEPLENYLIYEVLEMAGEMNLVVAVHSGVWGDFRKLDPRHMLTIAPAHPNTRFDLYHLGMPDVRAAIMVGKMCPNVWLNLCWTHVISQEQTCSGMNEMLDMVPINKILGFGGDYKIPVEKIVGHLRMAKEDTARVLGARIDRGRMSFDDAREIISLWFWQNPLNLYSRLDPGAVR